MLAFVRFFFHVLAIEAYLRYQRIHTINSLLNVVKGESKLPKKDQHKTSRLANSNMHIGFRIENAYSYDEFTWGLNVCRVRPSSFMHCGLCKGTLVQLKHTFHIEYLPVCFALRSTKFTSGMC